MAGSTLAPTSPARGKTIVHEIEIGPDRSRLKITLNLPPIQPRPPIPPKHYKKLYSHLDQVLPNTLKRSSSGRLRMPSSKLRDMEAEPAPAEPRALPSRATPTKERALAQFKGTGASRSSAAKAAGKKRSSASRTGLHPWIKPVIRHLASESASLPYAPTMLAGM